MKNQSILMMLPCLSVNLTFYQATLATFGYFEGSYTLPIELWSFSRLIKSLNHPISWQSLLLKKFSNRFMIILFQYAEVRNYNTLGVKKCEANQKQHVSRQARPKGMISAEAKKLLYQKYF